MKISHIVSILKILADLKDENKNKKHFCKYCLQCFSSEGVLIEHKITFFGDKWQTNCKINKKFN